MNDSGFFAMVIIAFLAVGAICYFGEKAEKNAIEHKRTIAQSARCPDRSPKGGELIQQVANSPCPSSHFCGGCKRHW